MKSTDLHAEVRQEWLRNEQAPRATLLEPARQSNFEKSAIFRWTLVAILLFIAVNVFESPSAHYVTV